MDYVVIVAGGKGTRMGTSVPKQFLCVGGKPVLMRTIEQFRRYSAALRIIVVLPREQQERWRELCREHHFAVEHVVADGGDSRFASSRSGLAMVDVNADGVVGFHDGVRPFVAISVIDDCYETARDTYAAIPVVPVSDTLRHVDKQGAGRNVQRSDYRIVQTPQCFDIQLAKRAFEQPESAAFTDDASVVEALGCTVSMVDGNRENIKLTTPLDMAVAELLASKEEH